MDDLPPSSESSAPPSYATSSLCPGVKQYKSETEHRSSISDQHHHKRQVGRYYRDSPPEMERQTVEQEVIPPTGPQI